MKNRNSKSNGDEFEKEGEGLKVHILLDPAIILKAIKAKTKP